MVGLVLVSHSRALAQAVLELARGVSAEEFIPIAAAGGTGENHSGLGTDATDIMEAVEKVYSKDGVLVLMDLGSSVLSSQMALELLGEEKAKNIFLCSAPLVEGAIGAAVQIAAGSPAADVKDEALHALEGKQDQIGDFRA
ncbi:MAG: PTS-dependent dihydroxyacetone kinase phosphotransferase subunit DhaM [Treponema sp.]|jgi:phosphocarrier protein FPr|nr:PTS-dependent dihydroxyacetone kinase phosphotransferase subunit DhaM [Treponema sp.]